MSRGFARQQCLVSVNKKHSSSSQQDPWGQLAEQTPTSGAGEQFLLLEQLAEKECFFADTGPANLRLRAKILDFRGLDSSRILILRGGILMSIGNSQDIFESRNLSREMLSREMLAGRGAQS